MYSSEVEAFEWRDKKNKVKELRNEKKIEDLDQIVVQMKRNPRKAWSILRKFLEKESNSPRQIENNEGAIVTGNTAAEVFANQIIASAKGTAILINTTTTTTRSKKKTLVESSLARVYKKDTREEKESAFYKAD
eukprot:g6757.t1